MMKTTEDALRAEYEMYKSQYGALFERQLHLEATSRGQAVERTKARLDSDKASDKASATTIGRRYGRQYQQVLADAYERFILSHTARRAGVRPSWCYTLDDLLRGYDADAKKLAGHMSASVLHVLVNKLVRVTPIHAYTPAIANILEGEYTAEAFSTWLETSKEGMDEANSERRTREEDAYRNGMRMRVNEHYRRYYLSVCMQKDGYAPPQLNHKEMIMLAMQLLYIARDTLAWFNIEKGERGLDYIVPTQAYIDAWERNEQNFLVHIYQTAPTIIPPKPWSDHNTGGYYGDLAPSAKLLRLELGQSTAFGKRYRDVLNQADLSNVLSAVNAIQATPWIVNKCVLEVIQELVRNGGNIAGIPNIYEDTKPAVLPEEPTKEDIERYKAIMPKWYKGEKRRKSLVLRALYTLRTAEKFKDEDAIYFPCNMDFRGRIYPIPSFNFQGDDLTKSLILFKDAPPCKTTKDIEWLAITGANIAGHDKIAYADRVAWITRNETHILQSASDPLGYTWWAEQDEPCQMLAFCFEWARWCEWRETHQGDPSGFVTGLPSHQDGTCSGLQHFSAILRDEIGGTAVNLVPQDTPNDIYARVADEVNCLLREDSTKGTPDSVDEKTNKIVYGTRTCAQTWLSFGVTRKVTKRPTMTLAYGAREFGYREQIMTDTIEPAMREQGDACVFNDHNKWRMSGYMAKIIWRSVSKVVIKACEGMKWLQLCAQIVAKEGKPVTWVTPLGLPVQQEYLVDNCEIVQMTVANKRIRVYSHSVTGDIDKHKQANGIAPNFIHSMDASHLMLTVNACALAGIRHFSTIHDSYGCPIAQTETMYRCVRQAFVDMYTDNDVLKSFAEDMKHLTTHTLPALPSKGALHLQDVLDSKYIFC